MKDSEAVSLAVTAYFRTLVSARRFLLGDAIPPRVNGVYAFSYEGHVVYVGEAAGSGGLYDRVIKKHLAGDEGHVLQKELGGRFPDRLLRRQWIKQNIWVQWVEIRDSLMATAVEKFAILIIEPSWNAAVKARNFK